MGFILTIKKLFGIKAQTDRSLKCEDCRKDFVFDEGEQRFFKAKGFTDPKRCPRCRKKVKTRLQKRGGRGHRNGRSRYRSNRNSVIDGDSPYADE